MAHKTYGMWGGMLVREIDGIHIDGVAISEGRVRKALTAYSEATNKAARKGGTLTLPLKGIYFDQIRDGTKEFEYRLCTPFWERRLSSRAYDEIILTKGYPSRDDAERRIQRPWRGCRVTTITHEHFGPNPVKVFAIRVN